MKIIQHSFFWLFTFTVIFLLALDFWSWDQVISFSLFQLPSWIFYFLGLQLILTLALLLFAYKFWKTSPD